MVKDSVGSVLWLDQITPEQRPQVGGKAAALGALRQAGLPVPNGFCIPLEAARHSPNKSDKLWSQIASAYRQLAPGDGAVVVRSSGVTEDSPEFSFAGQYGTVLNVRGMEPLRSAIEQCWQSAHSPRVRVYQAGHGYENKVRQLPLLVQRQVPATVSGVLFTRDPVSGGDGEMLIEATSGLGEALVSGHVAPVQYRVNQQGRVHAFSLEELLTPAQCRALAELGTRIERILGPGQDIEWAIAGDQIYILQARPITRSATSLPLSQMWTRANVGEVLPHVITPLTWAVFRATLLNEPASALGVSTDRKCGSEGIRRIHGRAYVRLDGLLDSFCYLPTVTPQVMGRVLGVNLPPAAQSYTRPAGLLVWLAQGAFVLDALGFLPRLCWMVRRLPRPPAAEPKKFGELVAWTIRCFQLHLRCTAYAIGAFGLLAHLLDRWMPAEGEVLLPQTLIGRENVQTATQGISLWRLAEQVRANAALLEVLDSGLDWPTVAQRLAGVAEGPEFLRRFQAFLEENGARTAGEFELAVPRWQEDPSFIVGVLRKFFDAQQIGVLPSDPAMRRRQRQEAIAHIQATLGSVQRWVFTRILASYSTYTTMRENVKYRLMEGYALLRHIFLEIGSDLAAKGVLESAHDVFFLTPREALALAAGDKRAGQPSEPWEVVLARKEQHADWELRIAPDLVVGDGQEVIGSQVERLTGIGCSPGTAGGFARVLFDISEADTFRPGEILVAPHTDPGWTPLFLSCKAVVTEIGGFLSHGATVAREYGVPAVVNVRGATTQIHTGDFIRVDGTSGRVTVCERADDYGGMVCMT